ncbi:MAG: endolytic transglycosylase MltG [Magnetococcales bacterium]|nr:endolytic transglycosylase MltG [Magnetococcales bacterium]
MLLLGFLAGGGAALDFYRFLQRPLPAAVVLEIERGWPLARIAETLAQQGVVSDAHWFILLTRWRRLRLSPDGITQGPGIQAGEYAFAVGETPAVLLTRLIAGDQVVHRLVVPEGVTVAEIGTRMHALGWRGVEELLADPEMPKKLGVPQARTLEGWLFPSTYHYRRQDTAQEMLARMVKQAQQVLNEQWQLALQGENPSPVRTLGWTPVDVLILASVIEKETGHASERARISAVFHNRLHKKMRLQSDPTVIYGILQGAGGATYDGNLTKKHLKEPTPYNTYTRLGLPPTPICNPGKAAIQAALHPEQVEDLYFVARGEGLHAFSKTLAEHEANVDRYQRHPSARAGGRADPGSAR